MKTACIHSIVRKVIVIAVVFFLVFSRSSVIFSSLFFQIMFARRDNMPETVRINYSMIDTVRYRRRPVSFFSGDNRLHGYLYGENGKKGLIIIAPGMNSDADAHLAETMRFVDSGFTVFAYDATGMFESGGESRVGLQQSRRDLLAALAFAQTEPSVAKLPVFLYGHSLGGYAAASVLAEAEVEAAISLSGFDSPVGIMYGKAKEAVGIFADVEYPFLYLQNVWTFGADANNRAVDGVNAGDTPVRIYYGSADRVIPYELSLYAHEDELQNPNASCRLIEVDFRNGHSYMWLSSDAARYVAELQDTLDDLKKVCGGRVPDDVLAHFYDEVDAVRATETDAAFMDEVCGFFERAVKQPSARE